MGGSTWLWRTGRNEEVLAKPELTNFDVVSAKENSLFAGSLQARSLTLSKQLWRSLKAARASTDTRTKINTGVPVQDAPPARQTRLETADPLHSEFLGIKINSSGGRGT